MNKPKHFYYITHKDNLKSILKKGILSRSQSEKGLFAKIGFGPKIKPIHSENVIQIRKDKKFKNRSLWDYANVYFEVRNPMLFSVIKTFGEENIIILQVNSDVLNIQGVGITNGNAASQNTNFFESVEEGLKALNPDQFKKEYWSDADDSKRTIMAEALIPDQIPSSKIIGIFTANQTVADQIRENNIGPLNLMPNPKMFFSPEYHNQISDNIILKKGDMFFSQMHTFTISVNTVGVMGKGLASRAKYQFPDVYVLYQDLCKQRKLKMGIPYLYKRRENFISSLMEDASSSVTENGHRWFLLFPTKNHWRDKSPISGIEQGLKWLVENYKNLEIDSIALPALGCGLGGLGWKDVGPLMCRYLNEIKDMESSIYLPLEKEMPKEQLQPDFLLQEKV